MEKFREIFEGSAFKVLKHIKAMYPKNQSAKTFQDIMKKPEYFVYSINGDTFKFGTEKSIDTGLGIEKSIDSVEKISGMSISDLATMLDDAGIRRIK